MLRKEEYMSFVTLAQEIESEKANIADLFTKIEEAQRGVTMLKITQEAALAEAQEVVTAFTATYKDANRKINDLYKDLQNLMAAPDPMRIIISSEPAGNRPVASNDKSADFHNADIKAIYLAGQKVRK